MEGQVEAAGLESLDDSAEVKRQLRQSDEPPVQWSGLLGGKPVKQHVVLIPKY